MKENKTYFFLTLLTMALAFFLLFKIYDGKKVYQALKTEYDNYKSEQKNKQEWSQARYWYFTFKYPKNWNLALFFTNGDHKSKTYAMSPDPIDMTTMGFSKGIYELTIYEDTSLYNDEFWKKTQENYLKELVQIEPKTINTEYGTINYYKAKEGQDTAPGQNVEVYFYKFNYTYKNEKGEEIKQAIYLKLELLYIEDWQLTEMMKEIALSIKPI